MEREMRQRAGLAAGAFAVVLALVPGPISISSGVAALLFGSAVGVARLREGAGALAAGALVVVALAISPRTEFWFHAPLLATAALLGLDWLTRSRPGLAVGPASRVATACAAWFAVQFFVMPRLAPGSDVILAAVLSATILSGVVLFAMSRSDPAPEVLP